MEAAAPASLITGSVPGADLLECPEGTLADVEQRLSVDGAPDLTAACRRDPSDMRHAIVALAYCPADEGDDSEYQQRIAWNDCGFSVTLLMVDIGTGRVLARRDGSGDFEWTGSLVGISIDTARYRLAPGVRAFGIRIQQHEGCSHSCEIINTQLTLYAQRARQFQKLLEDTVGEHQDGTGPDDEGYLARESVTVLCVSRRKTHGWADIWQTTHENSADTPEVDVHIDVARMGCGPSARDRMLWQYDGTKYVPQLVRNRDGGS